MKKFLIIFLTFVIIFSIFKFFIFKKTESKYKEIFVIENTAIFFENIDLQTFENLGFSKNLLKNTQINFSENFSFGILSNKTPYFLSKKEIFISSTEKVFSKFNQKEKKILIFENFESAPKLQKILIKTDKKSFGILNKGYSGEFFFNKKFSTLDSFETFEILNSNIKSFAIPSQEKCNINLNFYETKFCIEKNFFADFFNFSSSSSYLIEFSEVSKNPFFANISSAEISNHQISIDFLDKNSLDTKAFFWILSQNSSGKIENLPDGTSFKISEFKNFEIPKNLEYGKFKISCESHPIDEFDKKTKGIFCIAK
ncbi:MAG: hypothetical protein Fur0024_4810 [Patescibacteria group bacterium]